MRWKVYFSEKAILGLMTWGILSGCKNQPDNNTGAIDGLTLAKQYCSKCHSFVPAEALSKDAWTNGVLPDMARRLGIKTYANGYVNNLHDTGGIISFTKWSAIVDYYEKSSPDSLLPAKRPVPLLRDWSIFKMKKPARISSSSPLTTFVMIDTATRSIYSGDGHTNELFKWSNDLRCMDSTVLPSPPAALTFFAGPAGEHQGVLTCMGTMMAVDNTKGMVARLDLSGKLGRPIDTIATALPRPIQSMPADFNNDGLTDWVVCGFGHSNGGLFWYEQMADHTFKEHPIVYIPGATQSITGDFNKDGWQDIMTLFSDANEGIRLFLNDQKGGFTSRELLTFLPIYGSGSFQLADVNKDGLEDIIYTSGDNSDFSRILKPFHGLYIYLNKGNYNFEKKYFYPINGCTKAIAADFDGDGDLDIATLAFYADYTHHPEEKFIYFEQDSLLHFIPHSLPVDKFGRWICMDVNDYDHDGDPDIVVGSFSVRFNNEAKLEPNWDEHLPLMILENTSHPAMKTLKK